MWASHYDTDFSAYALDQAHAQNLLMPLTCPVEYLLHKLTLGIWIFQSAISEATGNQLKSNKIVNIFAMLVIVQILRYSKSISYIRLKTHETKVETTHLSTVKMYLY